MKRIRYIAVTAVAAASIGFGAAPASAETCPPDEPAICCSESAVNRLWRKLTGNDLYVCW